MRNYKTWLAVPLIAALLVWGLSWEAPATAGPGDDLMTSSSGWGDTGFAKKIAGTYLITFWFTECVEWIDGGEPPDCQEGVYEPDCDECTEEAYNTSGSGIVTIHSDGTFMFWSENGFGVFGAPPDCVTPG